MKRMFASLLAASLLLAATSFASARDDLDDDLYTYTVEDGRAELCWMKPSDDDPDKDVPGPCRTLVAADTYGNARKCSNDFLYFTVKSFLEAEYEDGYSLTKKDVDSPADIKGIGSLQAVFDRNLEHSIYASLIPCETGEDINIYALVIDLEDSKSADEYGPEAIFKVAVLQPKPKVTRTEDIPVADKPAVIPTEEPASADGTTTPPDARAAQMEFYLTLTPEMRKHYENLNPAEREAFYNTFKN